MSTKNYVIKGFGVYLACILICFVFAGCTVGKTGKWSMGYKLTGAIVPGGCVTASVSYFQNQALQVQPLLATKLTEALKDKILSNTSLKIVNGVGDVNFEGIIENYITTQPMAPQAGTDPTGALNRYSITIKVKYSNAKDQIYDFDFFSFTRFIDYKATLTPEAAEAANMDDLIKQLIDDVFNKAFVNW
jgi:Lipopolysaccharide-assembly